MPISVSDGWITIPQAAEALQVSTRTIRNMIARGDVPAKRIGPRLVRVNLDDVGRRIGGAA